MRKFLLFSLLSLIFISCEKQSKHLEINDSENTVVEREGMMILGEKLENPYSVENMQKAYHNLKKKKSDFPEMVIEATHLYIRFLPENQEEYDKLLWDSIIEIYDHPLDFEIIQVGNFYHDPTIPLTSITWQYCAIPINQTLPAFKYEVLAELFIPPTHSVENINKKNDNLNEFYDLLENESLYITNNLNENSKSKGSKWTPKGSVKALDDILNRYVPIQGVKVRANRWFTTYTAITDANGNYAMSGTFKNPADYSIVWEQEDFDVRDGNWGQATMNSKNIEGDWNAIISSGESSLHATIFRAAYRYYYNNTLGIKSPPTNKWYRSKIKIAAHDKDKDFNGDFAKWRNWLTWPQIRIYNLDASGNLKNRQSIFSTTIHELAHASHWDLAVQHTNRNDFVFADLFVVESWARGVQWAFVNIEYPNSNYRPPYFKEYSGIVEDFVDGINGYDLVSGYTMYQIEQSLKGAKTVDGWKNNLKNNYNNITKNNIDALFVYWQNY